MLLPTDHACNTKLQAGPGGVVPTGLNSVALLINHAQLSPDTKTAKCRRLYAVPGATYYL